MSVDKVRRQAFLLLDDIITNKKYSNLTLKNAFGGFSQRDKAFITAIVYGTLDKLINLDYVLSLYAKGKLQPKIRNILRMGAYQILYMDKVPDNAAVSTTVELAQSIGKGMLKGYINGVLRTVSREKDNIKYPDDKAQLIAYKYSYPLFFVNELIFQIGCEGAESFCAYNDTHLTTLRVDTSKADVNEVRQKLNGVPGRFYDDCFYISGEPAMLENGICSVQSEASMAAVHALGVEKGDRILDACAAPGGKTVYIASLIKNGHIVALDKHPHRVQLINNNAARTGYQDIISAEVCDMTKPASELGLFDKVLVDAPCSGLGVIGQKPEIKNTVTPEGLKQLEQVQMQILDNAASCVKKGGILVYSTCTVRKNENIGQINAFLERHKDFKLTPLNGYLGQKLESMCTPEDGCVQLYPHVHNTDGFFIARMKKD